VSAKKLETFMTEAGFNELETYGDFEFAKFSSDESEDIIVAGTKIS
jgi:hypothetical protein